MKARLLLHTLGALMGILLIGDSLHEFFTSGTHLFQSRIYQAIGLHIFIIIYGTFLLFPKDKIKNNRIFKGIFYTLSLLFILLLLRGVYINRDSEDFTTAASVFLSMILVGVIQIFLIKRKVEPGEVVNASQPAGLSENHLHD